MRMSWKRSLASLHDAMMAGVALYLAVVLRYGFDNLPSPEQIWLWVSTFVAIAVPIFWWFGLARGIWRFASVTDLRAIGGAASVSVLAFVLAMFALTRLEDVPRTVPIILWFVLVVLIGGPRAAYRLLKDGAMDVFRSRHQYNLANFIIVGSATEANRVIRSYGLETSKRFSVCGIVDYGPHKRGREVRGVPILGQISELTRIVERLNSEGIHPDAIILAAGREDKSLLQPLFSQLPELRIPLRRVTSSSLTDAKPDLAYVALEDLLGRAPARLEIENIRNLVAGRVVVLTGAGGSIGSEIVRQIAAYEPARLVLIDSSEFALYQIDRVMAASFPRVKRRAVIADVRDRARILQIVRAERPSLVFHAAALKHVPLVEENVCEGAMTNIIGSANVADAAVEAGVDVFVMISTDKAIRPTSIMGATKRMAEAYCQLLDVGGVRTRFITVRFGNVLGSTGSVVPLFSDQIKAGGPVTVTHPDMKRYFMSIQEATELVLQAAAAGLSRPEQRGRIFVLDMGEPIKILDLARTMIALAGLKPDEDIKIEFTGLRPGEKLFEELFDEEEITVPSGADGVFLASARLLDRGQLLAAMRAIEEAAREGDPNAVRQALSSAIPEFSGALLAQDALNPPAQDTADRGRVIHFSRS